MKKRIGLFVIIGLLVLTLGACSDKEPNEDKSGSQTKTESSSVTDKESKEEKKEEKDASTLDAFIESS